MNDRTAALDTAAGEQIEFNEEAEPQPHVDDNDGNSTDQGPPPIRVKKDPQAAILTVQMTQSLYRRIVHTAQQEGVSADDLAGELLAEGIVLRAWEIIERKSAMRGDSQAGNQANRSQQNFQGRGGQGGGNKGFRGDQNRGGQGQGQGGGNRGGRLSHAQYSNIMEDKAAFLEYVRQQEKKRR